MEMISFNYFWGDSLTGKILPALWLVCSKSCCNRAALLPSNTGGVVRSSRIFPILLGVEIMKYCSHCKETKPKKEFAKDKQNKDGLQNLCKSCHKILSGKHYKNNKKDYDNTRDTFRANYPARAWARSSVCNHRDCGFIINFSMDELYNLAEHTTHCRYCGTELLFTHKIRGVSKHDSPTLDRIDNEKEMTINNIQIICRECNTTKGARTHDEFIKYCSMIHNKFLSADLA